jgi:NADPH2:quinone reductase
MSVFVVATAFGGPEVLSVTDRPVPEPGPGQVAVSVRAVGVNPIDWKVYSGTMGADPTSLPMPLGYEAAGVVTALGDGVSSVAVGDEVIAYQINGAYAADLAVDVDAITPKPASLGWPEAAGLMLVGVTAVHALTVTNVHEGDTVLLHGAAGGVGLVAVQLAVARGATVIATASPRRHDALRALGAVPVAYGDGLADRVRAAAPNGVDVAIDLIGTDEAVDVSLELVADRQRTVSIAAFGRTGENLPLVGGGPGADPGTEIRMAARGELAQLAGAGTLHVTVDATYPLADVAEAHRAGQAGHAAGKIILVP